MEKLSPLGLRDIFGIILPGAILVFALIFGFAGILLILGFSVIDLFDKEFLLSVIIFLLAYLFGSIFRLFAADDVDHLSSQRLLKEWRKKYSTREDLSLLPRFQEIKEELAQGKDSQNIPVGFDAWLYSAEEFPYPAWQSRKWQAHDLREPLEFYRSRYLSSMWSENSASPKSFFNFCKLSVSSGGGPLAEEIDRLEGIGRFYAGTVVSLYISIWFLVICLVLQLILGIVINSLLSSGNILPVPIDWVPLIGIVLLGCVFIVGMIWLRRTVIYHFRRIRSREAETVFHAFYLFSCAKEV